MDLNLGDICYSIEDEELGYIMKVEVTSVNKFWIEFGNEAISSLTKIDECEGVLYRTYDEAAKYIKSLGKRPKLLVFDGVE